MIGADMDPAGRTHPTPVDTVQPDVAPLYQRHGNAMRASASRVLGSNAAADIDEPVSTVIASLMEAHSRGELRPKDNWEPYLRRATRNAALKIARDRGKEESLDALLEDSDSADRTISDVDSPDPVSDRILDQLRHDDVYAAIAQADLSHRDQEILHSYFVDQMTDAQIGNSWGISGQAVGQRRRRIQTVLREILEGGISR